ncbi:DUF4352 domain-containing protein [Archaeoglobus profundus]|uniref:DUF4352 domain-containing protein n=1 Tax=Archaeoglobus profundus (strain DSM 5631 / JCM 9629 / NBRC 100127 / Av18) TaxID=572546 RepID=D2RE88_ARCPA|nr:DUF4352 domain-containing protein [Archaeoglobus profundus]ADB58432.1 hypothetical protein Arcpr_1383 [Archaeoglobus profundus DSM 5631]
MRRIVIILALIMCGCVGKIDVPNIPNLSIANISDFNISNLNELANLTGINIGGNEGYSNAEIVLNVGESAEYEGVNVTVVNVKFSKDLKEFREFNPIDRYYGVASEGAKFMVVYVRIANNGNKTIYPTAHDFIVVDSHKNVYSYSVLTHSFQNALDLKELKKGEKVEGVIVFTVPENETKFKIAYCFESLADFRSFFNLFRNKWAVWVVG